MKRWKEFRFEYLRTAAVFLLLCAMACTLIWAPPGTGPCGLYRAIYEKNGELGLLQGDADGDLRPGDPITRRNLSLSSTGHLAIDLRGDIPSGMFRAPHGMRKM